MRPGPAIDAAMNDVAQRVVLITGAGSGIGAALALRLAAPDVGLLLHSRGRDEMGLARLEAVVQACRAAGAEVDAASGDLAEEGTGAAAVKLAIARFGRLDQLIHNAGFADRRLFGELKRDDLDASLRAMPGAFLEIVTEALPALAVSAHARVVVVSSFVAHRFVAGQLFPASAAAKAALEAMAKSLAVQLAATGATVNIVAPGFTRKDAGKHGQLSQAGWDEAASRNAQRRLAAPGDIAATIAFLLSDGAAHITGETIHVDGGLTLG
ncbi:NAD(P)-dependent dehydrogenase, short-chain alcohol dehydrogenase family [Rhizobiales bacterium GAS191]|nr:NAD(P)-dependent dehydrogenase, short-chain alcohol dehydrogenase family [Rhizobiales bacterium GAS113]SED67738.1 NAD(P)-dependent dehydrogenase, short-chain alcohol dehydrogenase family [Rhizobiales bacterium GAS191]SEE73931.1 NAD(P)-dependent dehydrogenase, short-chain alcohol dehydrogenase family [Rhizobiales bacterium GAS188]